MADINFLNTDDCTAITFNTPTTTLQFIEYMTGEVVRDYTNVDKYTITYSNNCCSPGTVVNVAPRYIFVPTIDSCNVGTNVYTIELAGIHGDLIQSFLVGIDPATPVITAYTNTAGLVTFNLTLVPGTVMNNITIVLTTISGFEYTITFIITQDANPLTLCSGVLSTVEITYPALPSNVVIATQLAVYATTGLLNPSPGISFTITADNPGVIGNNISIIEDGFNTSEDLVTAWNAANPSNTCTLIYTSGVAYIGNVLTYEPAGGIDVVIPQELDFNILIGQTTVSPGTYQVIICEVLYNATSTCIQNHIFIDCGSLKCQVVNKWIQCIDSNIMDFYNALTWSNDCTTTITYEEICALYEILWIILTSDNCYGTLDECNCSNATTIANKLHPVSYPTYTNTSPCSTC